MTSLDDPSGHGLAEAAHAAGVVEAPEHTPTRRVTIAFSVRGTPEHADAVGFTLASELTARSDIAGVVTVAVDEGFAPAEALGDTFVARGVKL